MNNNSENRKRAFADVVAIDAWHDNFSENVSTADLHADVVFGTARVGGESQSPVRFRLSVRRAEVIIVIPDSEPVSVDRTSVSRDAPELEGRLTQIIEKSAQTKLKGAVSATLDSTNIAGSFAAEAGAQANHAKNEKLEIFRHR
jgi:hypothetical protein